MKRHLIPALLLLASSPLLAVDYYVDASTGNDNNSGRSLSAPWKSLSKVNANNVAFTPGDTINFKSGQTFGGGPLLVRHSGTSGLPITFRIYGGTAKAILQTTSTTQGGVVFSSARKHIVLQDLQLLGPWNYSTGTGAYSPTGILLPGAYESIELSRVEVTGFQGFGILAENTSSTQASGLKVIDSSVHHVGTDGIRVTGAWNATTRQLNHRNVYIGYSTVSYCKGFNTQNASGSGIELNQVDGALIEYSEAHNTGSGWGGNGGGPIGIWSWDSNNVVIQYCYSHHNRNGGGSWDGGGFDIDGGDTNCIVQYCYSHDNDGPGYFLAHFGDSHPTTNNIFRYNISQNDSKASSQGSLNVWGGTSGAYIYNNVIVGGNASGNLVVRESSGSNIKFFNNIVVATGGNAVLQSASSTAIEYRNNCWWGTTAAPIFLWGGVQHSGLSAWRGASAQELQAGVPTGFQTDPNLQDAGNGPTAGWSATRLSEITAYLLRDISPLRDVGWSSSARYGIAAGTQDFYGNSLPQNSVFDLGAHETTAAPVTSIPAAPQGLQALPIAPRWVELQWVDSSSNESGFWIERSADGGVTYQHAATVGMNVSVYSDKSLTPATSYRYRVRTYNVAGSSAFGNTALVTTPGTGGNVALAGNIIAQSNQQIGYEATKAIDGIDNDDNNRWSASGYPQWLEVDLGGDRTITGSELVSALGRTYKFRIEVRSALGAYSTIVDRTANTAPSPVADTFTASTARFVKITIVGAHNYTGGWVSIREFKVWGSEGAQPAPAGPTDLSATGLSSSEIQLGWTDTSSNENGFAIEYRLGTGSWQSLSSHTAGTISATVAGLTASTTYAFRVRAYNDGGSSAWSNEVSATTSASGGSSSNLAVGGTVTGFSSQQTSNEAAKLIDGIDADDNNRWSASGYPNWVEIDLGAERTVTGTEVITYQGRIYKFKVEAKTTSGSYATIVDRTANTSPSPMIDALSTSVSARFVRLTVTGAHNYTGGWISIREMRILGY